MIRLIVLYNLHPFVDEEEFLAWRLTEHQQENMAASAVLRSDFARIDAAWPPDAAAPYRFVTTADWPDMESFRRDFLDPQAQERLQENLKMLKDPIFLIGEILACDSKEGQT